MLETYIKDASRTNVYRNKITLTPNQLGFFLSLSNFASKDGEDADRLKRNIFYGKSDDGIEGYFQTTAGGDLELNHSQIELLHGCIGCFTESVELIEAVKNNIINNQPIDITNIKEEMGDLMWYLSIMMKELNCDFDEIGEMNIAKLKARYPDNFSEERALNRELEAERRVLDKHS